MVASCGALGARRAAELGRPHDQRLVEQPPLFEVLQQPGDGLVNLRTQLAVALLELRVAIPIARALGAPVIKLHESHAALGQTPRRQAHLTERLGLLVVESIEPLGFLGPDLTYNGGSGDAYVAQVLNDGTGFGDVTYIGGDGLDIGFGIAADPFGSIYAAGHAESTEPSFPLVVGPDLTHGGASDAFVTKLQNTHKISGVLDAAGFLGLISPGSIVSVFGFFAEQTAVADSVPLSMNLNGFSVTFNDKEGALFGAFAGPLRPSQRAGAVEPRRQRRFGGRESPHGRIPRRKFGAYRSRLMRPWRLRGFSPSTSDPAGQLSKTSTVVSPSRRVPSAQRPPGRLPSAA